MIREFGQYLTWRVAPQFSVPGSRIEHVVPPKPPGHKQELHPFGLGYPPFTHVTDDV
jgi:hypothetical protein